MALYDDVLAIIDAKTEVHYMPSGWRSGGDGAYVGGTEAAAEAIEQYLQPKDLPASAYSQFFAHFKEVHGHLLKPMSIEAFSAMVETIRGATVCPRKRLCAGPDSDYCLGCANAD